jgi:NAD-dependent deacetylase
MREIPAALFARLRGARRVAALTGAGVSAESGVPTFRDAQTGLWAQYRAEELATPEAFQRNPGLVWDWYAWRRELVARARPNPGHEALAALARHLAHFTLITQNVDGLHQRAGSQEVIELHGNISRIRCSREGTPVPVFPAGESPPRCPSCRAWLRPDVVWFGEMLPAEAMARANEAAMAADVFFSIGTSSLVFPAAELPLSALRNGASVVEINPEETPLSRRAAWALHGPAGEILPALLRGLGID